MKTYEKMFRDEIDVVDGTVVLTEEKFKAIQADAIADQFGGSVGF